MTRKQGQTPKEVAPRKLERRLARRRARSSARPKSAAGRSADRAKRAQPRDRLCCPPTNRDRIRVSRRTLWRRQRSRLAKVTGGGRGGAMFDFFSAFGGTIAALLAMFAVGWSIEHYRRRKRPMTPLERLIQKHF